MKKKNSNGSAFEERFLNVLESYYRREPLIPEILEDEAFRKQSAAILWPCVDPNANLPELSKKWRKYWNPKFKNAIRGVEDAVNIYTNFENNPSRVRILTQLRDDLLEKQRKRTVLPAGLVGHGHDWTCVLFAKNNLNLFFANPYPIELLLLC